ncbi:(d)CMP kinase [Dyadobacter sp. CY351]|uniref:(d)CMP kinase n=1 Tax=Dyadobacter sp. CY351 TaxID=2909337 RepID=UPI001F459718|nr:(d)CMP kinase [Dyadobacter sp. CY351]MCF2518420.1 (d)CMP kinase [Dyadobacter sp. CY351]
MKKIIIAIDGFSSCGKSSTAKKVAERLQYPYIDTGAMYRAVTLCFINKNVDLNNFSEVTDCLNEIAVSFKRSPQGDNEVYLNGTNVESEVRKMYVSEKVAEVSANPLVRKFLVRQQQQMGEAGGLVLDGRDIGTIVFPDAQLKIFMTADPAIRAQRRHSELFQKGEVIDLQAIRNNLENRDYQDMNRTESPLKQAIDAILVDNSDLTFDEQVDLILALANERIANHQVYA